jgi:hypothetical protein
MDSGKKKCFVVMGFGQKTDYATSRTLDLDKTYRIIIKRAVEEAGLECVRADDVIHSGVIDQPMYELLLDADLVIADLSTSNPNAIYELGVRHALRPYTTIVIAEKQFKFPFDLHSLLIRPYEHLGKGIDAEEAEKVREELKAAISTLMDTPKTDSPVYTFLPHLGSRASGAVAVISAIAAVEVAMESDATVTQLNELFKEARADEDWRAARKYLGKLLEKRPNDSYLKQQLALATYKSKLPSPEAALQEARTILQTLGPQTTTDPETLGLWGAIHKRRWEIGQKREDLDESIWAYEKGFYLKNDYYNGINLAFLLNIRAPISSEREAIADTVIAERIRRRVAEICEKLLAFGIKNDDGRPDPYETFWIRASLVEALVGFGERERANELKRQAVAEAPEGWMPKTLEEQLEKLERYLVRSQESGVRE